MIKWRQIVVLGIATFLLSTVFFLYVKQASSIGYSLYILFCTGIIVASLVSYQIKKSPFLYRLVDVFLIVNLLTFLFFKYENNAYSIMENISLKIAYVLYCVLLALLGCQVFKRERKSIKKNTENLFLSRTKDLERLKECLLKDELKSNRIGIVGGWGSGKTFLLKMLFEDDLIKNNYEILTIESLSLNVEQVQSCIIAEIEKIFRRERIYSHHSSDLNSLLKKEHWYTTLLNFLFFKTASYSSSLDGMKSDLEKLEKKILLVIEDVDRLNELISVHLIFDIVEKLTTDTEKIKAVFLFSEENLKRVDSSLNHEYVEKYIPYLINISDISFEEIIKVLIQKKKKLKYSDFSFLLWEKTIGFPFGVVKVENVLKKMKVTYSIRKIEIFLEELSSYLEKIESNDSLEGLEYKNTIITIFFLKHFCHDFYTKLNTFDSVLDQLKIEYGGHDYTVFGLIDYQREKPKEVDVEAIVANDVNCAVLWVVHNLGFKLYVDKVEYLHGNLTPILTESVKNVQQKNYNDVIDRIVKNVINSGVDVDTNAQKCVNMLKSMVLDQPKENRVEKFEQYDSYVSKKSNEEIGFHSVFHHIGINRWVDLFKAFRAVEITEGVFDLKNKTSHSTEHWIALIDLFVESSKALVVDDIVMEVFSYCNLENKNVFLRSIEWFCSMRIELNYNNEKCFGVFVDKYISAIGSLGYAVVHHTYLLSDFPQRTKGNITYKVSIEDINCFVLNPIIDYLERANKSTTINSVMKERNLVIAFVKKIEDMMAAPLAAQKVGQIKVNTSISEHYMHENEMNRIKALGLKGQMLKAEIEKSYNEGKLFPIEVDELLRNKLPNTESAEF